MHFTHRLTSVIAALSLLAPSLAHAVDLLIITNTDGNSFTVANQNGGTVYSTVTGLSVPMDVAVNGTGAYIVGADTNELYLYDTTNFEQEGTVSIGSGPRRVAINGTGAYVTNLNDDTVTVIDITDFQVVTSLSVGDGPNDVGFSGTGAYVVNLLGNSVTVIDTTDLQTVTTVAVASAPQTIAFYGTGAYITRYSASQVSVIDMTTNTVDWSFSSGNSPRDMVIAGTGAYITNQFAQAVSVVDVTDGVLVATISVGDTPFSINGTGTGVYVANIGEATVSVIDTTSLAVEDTITVGDSPFGIAFFADPSTVDPILTAPTTGSSIALCDDLTITYALPETPMAGTVQLQFYNTSTHTSVYATLTNGTGATFGLDLENFTLSANVVSTTNGSSLSAGSYVLYLSYQDVFGNVAADDSANLTVTACGSSSSSSSSSSAESSEGGGGGGGGGGRRGSGTTYSSSRSSVRSTSSSTSRASASSITKQICENVQGVAQFTDVESNAWYDCYSRNVSGLKIFEGYKEVDGTLKNLFGPSDNITLGQLAKVGTILRNKEDLAPKPTGDEWYLPYVGAVQAYDAAVFVSTPDPLKAATRAEVIHTIMEALGIPMEGGKSPYDDVSESIPYSPAIIMATKLGFVSGDDGTKNFRPNDPVNRAEVAKMLSLALAHVGIVYEDTHAAAASSTSSPKTCMNILARSYPVRATPSMGGTVLWYMAPRQAAACEEASGGWVKLYGPDGSEGYVQNVVVNGNN